MSKRDPERVVGYVRVSTEEQADNRISIDSQIRLIKEDAEAKGQLVVAIFIEPGFPAAMTVGPSLTECLPSWRIGRTPYPK